MTQIYFQLPLSLLCDEEQNLDRLQAFDTTLIMFCELSHYPKIRHYLSDRNIITESLVSIDFDAESGCGKICPLCSLDFFQWQSAFFFLFSYMEVAISMVNTRIWFYGTNRKLMGSSVFGFQDVG
jgi:hypothetical protein